MSWQSMGVPFGGFRDAAAASGPKGREAHLIGGIPALGGADIMSASAPRMSRRAHPRSAHRTINALSATETTQPSLEISSLSSFFLIFMVGVMGNASLKTIW